MKYRFTSAALRELSDAALYYNAQHTGLGQRFVTEVENTICRILATPEAWRPLSVRSRRCLLHHFPFGVVYQIRTDEILIISILDLRRDPKKWRTLL